MNDKVKSSKMDNSQVGEEKSGRLPKKGVPANPTRMIILAVALTSLLAASTTTFAICGLLGVFSQKNVNNNTTPTTATSETTETVEEVQENAEEVAPMNASTEEVFRNPVIADYALTYNSLDEPDGSNTPHRLNIKVSNGAIASCLVMKRDGYGYSSSQDCNITGISGRISKVAGLSKGQMTVHSKVAFIMEDGSVEYLSMEDAILRNDFAVKGKVKVDKPVVDILEATTQSYGVSILVFADGSYVEYDDSMLQ